MRNVEELWSVFWPAVLFAFALPLVTLTLRRRVALPPWEAFVLPGLGPITVLTWVSAFWGVGREHPGDYKWVPIGFAALVLGSLIVILDVVGRYRRAPRYWIVVLTAVINLAFLARVVLFGMIGLLAPRL